MAMNILKKSRVLNQNCLREKIRELSPLLRNLDWPPSKDSVFRATWSYYACGCQERLSSIRRRIEQNARMVAPNKRTSTPLPVDLKLPFNEGQLPAGLDEDEHIYRELVSCFRNAESTGSMKRTPPKRSKIQRSFDVSKFSTPEQWINWKREEQQVGQLMEKSFDPYLKEEMSKKLQHLKKLTNRRPLVEVPIEKEIKEKPKLSLSKKRKSRLKYIDKSMSGTNESTNTPTKPIDKYKTPLNSGKTFLKSADQYNPASSSSTTYTNLEEKYNDLLNSTKTPANLVDKYKLPPSLRKTPTKLAEKYKLSPNLSKTYTKLADKYEFPSSSRKNHTILSENYKVPSSSRKTPPKFAEKYKVPSKSSKTSTKLAENNNLTPNLSKTYTKLADKYEFPPSSRKNHKILSENYKLSSSSRKIPAKFAEYKVQSNLSKTSIKLADKYKFPSSSRKKQNILLEKYKLTSSSRKTSAILAEKYKPHSSLRKAPNKLPAKYELPLSSRKIPTDKYKLPSSSRKTPRKLAEKYKRHSNSRKIPIKLPAKYKIHSSSRIIPTKFADKYKLSSSSRKILTKLAKKYKLPSNSMKSPTRLEDMYEPPSKSRKNAANLAGKNQFISNFDKIPLNSGKTPTNLADINKIPLNSEKTPTILTDIYKLPLNSRKTSINSSHIYKLHTNARKTSMSGKSKRSSNKTYSSSLERYNPALALKKFITDHPSLESIASSRSRRSTTTPRSSYHPRPKGIQKTRDSSDEETGIYGIDYPSKPLDEDSKSVASQKLHKGQKFKRSSAKKYPENKELKNVKNATDREDSNLKLMDEDKSLAKKRNILEHELKNVKTPTDKKDSNSKLLDENIKPLTSQQLHKAPKLNMSTDKKGKIFKQSKNAALKNVKNAEGEGDSRHSSSLSQFSWKSDSELYNKNIKIAQRKKNESKSGHFSSHAILKKSKSSGSHFSSHAILKKSKSSGSHFSSHAILKKSNSGARFKSPRESNSGELRQNFIARKRSSSLVRLRPPKSYEYIRRVMKGMSVSDPSFGSLKKKQINSTLSIYRGETNRSHYGVPSQEIRRSEVLGGDHHGWPLNVKQHIAYVNPIKQNSIKPHQLNTKTHHKTAEKEHDFDLARNSDVAVESKPIIFLKKPDQETLLSSKFDVSVSDLEVSLSYESKPLVIADLISKFMESYGSEMGLFQTCPDLFKINELDGVFIETVINPIKPKGRKKTRKHKVKKVKESKVREVKKMPSKPFKIACSLCNLVRRRQSELRPYMQRMQKQRQRLELRTYYIQNLLKCRRDQQQDVQERKRTSAREVLTRCYQTLNLCQQILEQRQLNKCQPQ